VCHRVAVALRRAIPSGLLCVCDVLRFVEEASRSVRHKRRETRDAEGRRIRASGGRHRPGRRSAGHDGFLILIAVEPLFSAGTGSSRSHGERGSPTRAGSLEPGAMVGEMTASIAHELKQPLATIMSNRTLPSASIGARTQRPVGAIVLNFAVNSVDAVGGEPTERRRID
jgi:signal transduction histidine kinase